MRKKAYIFKLVGGLLLLVCACVVLFAVTFKLPKMVGIENFEMGAYENGEMDATMEIQIHNPNWVALGAKHISYILSYHDTLLARGDSEEGFSLPSGDTAAVELQVKLDLPAISAVHKGLWTNPQATFEAIIEGEFGMINKHLALRVPVSVAPKDFIGKFLDKVLSTGSVGFTDLAWEKSDLQASEFSFNMKIKNPLQVPMRIDSASIYFSRDKSSKSAEGSWKLTNKTEIGAGGVASFPAEVRLNHLGIAKATLPTLFKGELRYHLYGAAKLSLDGLPFEIPLAGVFVFRPLTGKGEFEPEQLSHLN
jgi:LEA14-like dessication related protein